jgi:hypothetical protein
MCREASAFYLERPDGHSVRAFFDGLPDRI